jgi:AhpC/TSA family protein
LPYLTAAVILVGVVALTALLLVIALARRLPDTPAGRLESGPGSEPAGLPTGSKPGSFRAETTSGGTVSLADLAGDRALLGFFFAGCTPCNRQLPAFMARAKTMPGGPGQVIAVISGRPDKIAEYAARLDDVATVVPARPRADEGTISHAFAVSSWPSYYLLDSTGTVESSATAFSELVVPVMASRRR